LGPRLLLLAAVALALPLGAARAAPDAPGPRNGPIAFAGAGGLYTTRADGRGQRRVLALENAANPAWSADARQIAFDDGENVGIVEPTTGSHRMVTRDSAIRFTLSTDPDWSPDGRWLAVARIAAGASRVTVLRPNGSSVRRIGPGRSPEWSPDGRELAFVHEGKIGVMRRDGSRRRMLVRGVSPAWSRDGRRLAFVRPRPAFPSSVEVHVVGRDGTRLRRLGGVPRDWRDPVWSPDGRKLLVTRFILEDVRVELWSVDLETGRRQRVLRAVRPVGVDWAPAR
jgi:TolB protein